MKVYLFDPRDLDSNANALTFCALESHALADRHRKHVVVESPEAADLIIAATSSNSSGVMFYDLTRSRFYHQYCSKLFVYCYDDIIMPRLPGVYPGTTPQWSKLGWTAGGHYISNILKKFDFQPQEVQSVGRSLLFSFVGAAQSHPIRDRVMLLTHPRSLMLASESTSGGYWWNANETERTAYFSLFRQSLVDSKFVLCPRGKVANSIRTFETLEAGAVPVIIADDIVLPDGPDWDRIALRIPENEIDSLPAILEREESRFPEMSRAGRAAWEAYFAPDTSFHTIVESVSRISRNLTPARRESISRASLAYSWLNKDCFRARLRYVKHRMLKRR